METFREYLGVSKNSSFILENEEGSTDLIEASMDGDVAKVKAIIKSKKFNINATDEYGYTALISATYNGHVDIVKLLLKINGINLDAQVFSTTNRKTALHYAFECDDTEGAKISKLLLDAGANPRIGDKDDITPIQNVLSNALEYGKKKIFGVYKRAGVIPKDRTQDAIDDVLETLEHLDNGFFLKDAKLQTPGSYDKNDIYIDDDIRYKMGRLFSECKEKIEKLKYKSKL